ncbi:MAG: PEP-CTERM sorting domain-containing protein [Proteobacteria bacterium]|nr:PEP-CTERM sorting domain-containing protein [Pseudomonadota bacterium]MBU4011248.1 PEP-CTERM sorting domain-containing protein [Pseudomonadota bacterium]
MIKKSAKFTTVTVAMLFLALILSIAATASADTNVALNKPVTLSGEFGVLRSNSGWETGAILGSPSTINDGIFFPERTQWNSGSIWWDSTVSGSENNSIVIDLQGAYHITGIITQADNNDKYYMEYLHPIANMWIMIGWWPEVDGWGLMTRPDGDQVTQSLVSFDASKFRLTAYPGDGYYAYSEFQAFGTPIPEPATMLLLGLGLMGLAGVRKKIKK